MENLPPDQQPNASGPTVGAPLPPVYHDPEAERAKAERARRNFFIGIGIAIVLGILLFAAGGVLFFYMIGKGIAEGLGGFQVEDFSEGTPNVALIRVRGVLSCSGVGGAAADRIVEDIHKALEDDDIKVILLRLDTPGGTIASAQEIYAELMKARKAGKKIVASMGDAAASGGYYIATPADVIIANPGTATGSIGVIMETIELDKLLEKLGIHFNVIKSGKFKDFGSYFRPMTEEERKLAHADIMDMYDQFVHDVAQARNLPVDKVRKLADGRVYSGKQAKALGLVDRLGNYEDALDACKELGHLDKVRIKEYGPSIPLDRILQMLGESAARGFFNAALEYQARTGRFAR